MKVELSANELEMKHVSIRFTYVDTHRHEFWIIQIIFLKLESTTDHIYMKNSVVAVGIYIRKKMKLNNYVLKNLYEEFSCTNLGLIIMCLKIFMKNSLAQT